MGKGIGCAVGAACLFGLIYYFPILLKPLSVVEMFCWRLMMSCPAIAGLIVVERRCEAVFNLVKRIKKQPLLLLAFLFSSSILAVQMLIFIWAPLNGNALSTSLGYFILPLTMVIVGRFIYKEKFSIYQKIAIVLAVLGVMHEVWITGTFFWETIVVAIGYPVYIIFRREMNIDGIEGTFADFLLIAIGCAIYMMTHYTLDQLLTGFLYHPVALPMLGIITATGFAIYFAAAKLLPLGLFGLLSYLEPVLLTIVSIFFLHETLSQEHILTYMMIWAAICVLTVQGTIYAIRGLAKQKFLRKITAKNKKYRQ